MRRLVILTVLGGMLAGCGGGESGAPPTGPGGPAPVAAVTVTPPADTVLIGAAVQLAATLKDAAGNTLTGRPVIWTSSDPRIASVGTTGMVAGVSLGTTTITATAEGKSGTASVSVMAVLAAVSGDNQTDTVGQALGQPLVAKVTGVDGGGVAGIPVTFAVTAGGGALSSSAASTDANGLASAILTLGTAAGPNLVTASGSGLQGSPVTFTARAVADAPAALMALLGDGQTGCTLAPLATRLSVAVRDRYGNPVPQVSVTWTVTAGGGSVSSASTPTTTSGEATAVWRLGQAPAANELEAAVAALAPVRFTATALTCTGVLAFMSGPGLDIFKVDADGQNLLQLTTNPNWDRNPAWSPDGSRIAFTTVRPDASGTLVQGIAVMNADGSGQTILVVTGRDVDVPTWSPDGSKIAFYVDSGGYNIYEMNANGTGLRSVTSGFKFANYPTYSPDGRRIMFVGRTTLTPPSQLWVINSDGTGLTQITNFSQGNSPGGPAWSPDGSKIAFGCREAPQICIMSPDGTGVRQITNFPSGAYSAAWSPDASRIVFWALHDGTGDIFTMNPDGTDIFLVPNTTGGVTPSWGRKSN